MLEIGAGPVQLAVPQHDSACLQHTPLELLYCLGRGTRWQVPGDTLGEKLMCLYRLAGGEEMLRALTPDAGIACSQGINAGWIIRQVGQLIDDDLRTEGQHGRMDPVALEDITDYRCGTQCAELRSFVRRSRHAGHRMPRCHQPRDE